MLGNTENDMDIQTLIINFSSSPLVTEEKLGDTLLKLIPIIISISVVVIGYFQFKINKHKLKLDLYNRRFLVYERTLDYFQAYYFKSANEELIDNAALEFIKAYRESTFLFGNKSTVYILLTELKDTLNFLIYFDRKFKDKIYDDDEYKASSNAKSKKRDLSAIMNDLESSLTPWLDFKKIT
jgi:hypothetical protein